MAQTKKLPPRVMCSLPHDDHARLLAAAKAEQRTVTTVLQRALDAYLSQHHKALLKNAAKA